MERSPQARHQWAEVAWRRDADRARPGAGGGRNDCRGNGSTRRTNHQGQQTTSRRRKGPRCAQRRTPEGWRRVSRPPHHLMRSAAEPTPPAGALVSALTPVARLQEAAAEQLSAVATSGEQKPGRSRARSLPVAAQLLNLRGCRRNAAPRSRPAAPRCRAADRHSHGCRRAAAQHRSHRPALAGA